MPILNALEGVDKLIDYLTQTDQEKLDKESCVGLLDFIKNELIKEIPVKGLNSGSVFKVLSDCQGTFKEGQTIRLIEICDDGVHYFTDGKEYGYMKKNEVEQIKGELW